MDLNNDTLITELKLLERYLSVPIVYLDEQSGNFCIKSGGTKQELYRRYFNAKYYLKNLIGRLEGEDNGQQ